MPETTILEALSWGQARLAEQRFENPGLQAEWLLAHVLKQPRLNLYLERSRALSTEERVSFENLLEKRLQHVPLEHLIGAANFCGLEIEVSPDTLIPRPETEFLAELGWKFLNQQTCRELRVLDWGTGSGCIAIALAVHCQRARVTAIDISEAASSIAQRNASCHAVDSRIDFLVSDGFAAVANGTHYDLVVSNPPYIPRSRIESLQPEVRDFDPRPALDGGVDGLDFHRRLANEAGAFVKRGGRLMVEFGDGQEPELQKIFHETGWRVDGIEKDLSRTARFLIASRARK